MHRKSIVIVIVVLVLKIHALSAQELYITEKGQVNFTSDAPLELIKAKSVGLDGILKISDRSFAFRVPMKSFEGFNSQLQKTHFNENYVESSKYQYTIFEGKIIEDIDFNKQGTYNVRGKGKFVCHGVEQERIIKCTISIENSKIRISSEFTVLLEDHNIKIPSVVSQKIAGEISVAMETVLVKKK